MASRWAGKSCDDVLDGVGLPVPPNLRDLHLGGETETSQLFDDPLPTAVVAGASDRTRCTVSDNVAQGLERSSRRELVLRGVRRTRIGWLVLHDGQREDDGDCRDTREPSSEGLLDHVDSLSARLEHWEHLSLLRSATATKRGRALLPGHQHDHAV